MSVMLIIVQALRWLLLSAEACSACPIAYLCILSFSAAIQTRKHASAQAEQAGRVERHTRFAIFIPAHNEEVILAHLLESLYSLEYARESYTVFLIADNCSDGTAAVARGYTGVQVFERFDALRRSKGYALSWMWQQLAERELIYDAYVILDADSVIGPTFLQALDTQLQGGAQALQACNTVLNVSAAPSTALRWIALSLINHVRPLGRNGIGGSSTLTGNGMCLSRAILQRHPWRACGLAEDYQYYLTLVQADEWVRYVPEAVVCSHMPTTFAQMRTQDVRWEAAQPHAASWRIALRLLRSGLRLRSFTRLEAAAELLTPPLSFLVSMCVCLFVASLLLRSALDIATSLLLLAGLAVYLATPFCLLHPERRVYTALLHAPGFMLWKLWVYFVLSRSRKHTGEWVRTSRPSS